MPNNWVGTEGMYAETWNRTIGAWPVGQGVGSADMMAERNGALRQARIRNRKTPTAPSVSGQHASKTGKPRQDSGPPGSHWVGRAAASSLKAKVDGWSRKLWQAAGIGWADVTARSRTVRHQLFQRHVTAPSVTSEHASETGKPQQDSGPLGCHLVGRAAAVWHLRTR